MPTIEKVNNQTQVTNTEQNFDDAIEAAREVVAVTQGRIWGDPHFVGQDGGLYDVQGELNKFYNLLSDQNVQVNAQFVEPRSQIEGLTVVGQVGITTVDGQILVNRNGSVEFNGESVSLIEGAPFTVDGTMVEKVGNDIIITTGEYKIKFVNSRTTDIRFSSPNANADGVLPDGLWGFTVDSDSAAVSGRRGVGAQGEGALKDVFSNFEVSGLFDVGFELHNKFRDPNNLAPTAVTLVNVRTDIAEIEDTSDAVKIADIVVADDALGNNKLALSGVDADIFEIVGTELFLKAGTDINFESAENPDHQFDVTVKVKDFTAGNAPAVTADHSLAVTNVNEAPTAIYLDSTISDEELVDTTITSRQTLGTTAALAGGGYITVWNALEPSDPKRTNFNIFAQIYDENGNKIRGEFPINVNPEARQVSPQVTGLSDGGFVVVWTDWAQEGDGRSGVFGQRYDANGDKVDDEFHINTTIDGFQSVEDIKALSNGGFVVTWSSTDQDGDGTGVYSQVYDASADKVGVETLVNTSTTGNQSQSQVTALDDGGFIVTWTSDISPDRHNRNSNVILQRFNALGEKVGAEVPVNTSATGLQGDSDITVLSDGSYVVVWRSIDQTNGIRSIFTQRYASDGTALGAETFLASSEAILNSSPEVTALSDGGYVIVWNTSSGPANLDVLAKRFDAEGNALSGEILINQTTEGHQQHPHVETLSNGKIVFTWTDGTSGAVGDFGGIYQRIMDAPQTVAENATPGTIVGILSNNDPDVDDSHTYVLTDDAGGRFVLGGANNNEIHVAAGLDFETAEFHDIEVQVTDGAGLTHTRTLRINVRDVEEGPINQPPTDITLEGGSIAENATAGDEVGTLVAIDPDEGEVLEYEMLNDPSGFFEIDKDTGKILVAAGATLDFETANTHDITVQVKDSADHIFTKTVTLTVTDVNEAPTAITIDDDTIPENANIGAVVGTLTTADPDTDDTADYLLIDNAGGRFVLGGANMDEIHVAAGLDFETNESHDIEVQVTDSGGLTHIETITINVDDVIENNPPTEIIVTDDGAVDENSPEGTVAAILSAAPFDAGDVFTYTLVDDPSGFFEILDGQNIIRVKDGAELNHEEADQHVVKVVVDDGQGGTHAEDITITVTDVNEQPTDIILTDTGSVPENSPENTIVGLLNTIDPDDSDSFEYTLIDDAGGRFKINPGDNHIRVAANADLNFEDNETHTVTVEVEDSGGLKRTKTITINVIDVKEAPEDIIFDLESIDKNAPAGTIVATMSVKDDAGDTVRYELVTGSTDYEIRDGENVIRVKEGATLTQGIDNLQVKAIDTVNADHFLIEGVAITVEGVVNPPTDFSIVANATFGEFGGHASVLENSSGGTLVANLTANGDGQQNVTYTLSGAAANLFDIVHVDNFTSQLVIKSGANLDFESSILHDLTIEAHRDGALFRSEDIKIAVLNEQESPTRITFSGGSIPSNALAGQTVGILFANDDPGDGSYTYTLQNDTAISSNFEIIGNRLVVKEGGSLESGSVRISVSDGNVTSSDNLVTISITAPVQDATVHDLLLTPEYTFSGINDIANEGLNNVLFRTGNTTFSIDNLEPITRNDWEEGDFRHRELPGNSADGLADLITKAVATNDADDFRNILINDDSNDTGVFDNNGVIATLAESDDGVPEIRSLFHAEEKEDNDFALRFGLAFTTELAGQKDSPERKVLKDAIAQVMPWAKDLDIDKLLSSPAPGLELWGGISWEMEARFDNGGRFEGYFVDGKRVDDDPTSFLAGNPVELFTDGLLAFSNAIQKQRISTAGYYEAWQNTIESTEMTEIIPDDEFATWEDLGTPTIGVAGMGLGKLILGDSAFAPSTFYLHDFNNTFGLDEFDDDKHIIFTAQRLASTARKNNSSIANLKDQRIHKNWPLGGAATNLIWNMDTSKVSGGVGVTATLVGRARQPAVLGFLLGEQELSPNFAGEVVVSVGFAINPALLIGESAAAINKILGRIPGGKNLARIRAILTAIAAGGKALSAVAPPWLGLGWNVTAKFEDGKLRGLFADSGKEINMQKIVENFMPPDIFGEAYAAIDETLPNIATPFAPDPFDILDDIIDDAINGEPIGFDLEDILPGIPEF